MKKKKTPLPELPPDLIQEGPAIGLPIDPAAEVIQDAVIVKGVAVPVGKSEQAPSAESKEVTKVVAKPWTGPRYEYDFLTAQGPYATPDFNDKFKAKGAEGWEFIGRDGYGRCVFKRPVTS